jgi:hypothetical protein
MKVIGIIGTRRRDIVIPATVPCHGLAAVRNAVSVTPLRELIYTLEQLMSDEIELETAIEAARGWLATVETKPERKFASMSEQRRFNVQTGIK